MINPQLLVPFQRRIREAEKELRSYLTFFPLKNMTAEERQKYNRLMQYKRQAENKYKEVIQQLTIITKVEPIFFDGLKYFVWVRIEDVRKNTVTASFKTEQEAQDYYQQQVKKMNQQERKEKV